jgi:hypothetical protein
MTPKKVWVNSHGLLRRLQKVSYVARELSRGEQHLLESLRLRALSWYPRVDLSTQEAAWLDELCRRADKHWEKVRRVFLDDAPAGSAFDVRARHEPAAIILH